MPIQVGRLLGTCVVLKLSYPACHGFIHIGELYKSIHNPIPVAHHTSQNDDQAYKPFRQAKYMAKHIIFQLQRPNAWLST